MKVNIYTHSSAAWGTDGDASSYNSLFSRAESEGDPMKIASRFPASTARAAAATCVPPSPEAGEEREERGSISQFGKPGWGFNKYLYFET